MDKEEILEKSRKENKNQDIYEKDVIIQGNQYACMASAVFATAFLIIQILIGGGINYGLYAVVFSMPMAGCWFKFYKLRKKRDFPLAVGYTVATLLLFAGYLYNLISASAIL